MPKHNENFGFLDVLHIFEYTSHGARQKGYMLGKHLFSFFFFCFFNDQERSKQGHFVYLLLKAEFRTHVKCPIKQFKRKKIERESL
jgi:hypothetical protein